MFDQVSDSLNGVFRRLSGQGKISEDNVREAMSDVRTSLLEADVHYDVVQKFCQDVLDDAIGAEVTRKLKPGQEMIGIVHRRLIELLGGNPDDPKPEPAEVMRLSPGPTVIMMCGLQGSGKTTTCGKLAWLLRREGRTVMLCAADLQRPAAIDQLETVAATVRERVKPLERDPEGTRGIRFYAERHRAAEYGKAVGVAVEVCQNALKAARAAGVDVLILDTAGRLHINDELMGELQSVRRSVQPHHTFLVTDAMTGQDAVTSAKAFHQRLSVDGLILTKFDSDTRGGAALSVKTITGAPIRYIGVGEHIDAIEAFHPQRMAGRILGMGDVVSLVERAQLEISEEEAARMEQRMARGEMDMNDFLKQLRSLRRMGPLKQIMGLLPGVGQALKDVQIDDGHLDHIEAQINSMTDQERAKPDIINTSRRKRIAAGSGADQQEVSGLVKQFGMLSKMTKQMAGLSGSGRMAAMRELQASGGMDMFGLPSIPGLRSKGSTSAAMPGAASFKKRKPGAGGAKKRKR